MNQKTFVECFIKVLTIFLFNNLVYAMDTEIQSNMNRDIKNSKPLQQIPQKTENSKDTTICTTKILPKHYDYLAPDKSEIRLMLDFKEGSVAHCTLPPGKVARAMYHQTVNEIWYVIEGEGEFWRLDETGKGSIVQAKKDTAITIPKKVKFQFRSTGQVPLKFIVSTFPCWPGPSEAVPTEGPWKPSH